MQLGLGSCGRRRMSREVQPASEPAFEPVGVVPDECVPDELVTQLAVELPAQAAAPAHAPKTEPVEACEVAGPAEVCEVEIEASPDEGSTALSAEAVPADEESIAEVPAVPETKKTTDWRDADDDWLVSKRRSRTSIGAAAAAWQGRMSTSTVVLPRHVGVQQARGKLNAKVKTSMCDLLPLI